MMRYLAIPLALFVAPVYASAGATCFLTADVVESLRNAKTYADLKDLSCPGRKYEHRVQDNFFISFEWLFRNDAQFGASYVTFSQDENAVEWGTTGPRALNADGTLTGLLAIYPIERN